MSAIGIREKLIGMSLQIYFASFKIGHIMVKNDLSDI